MEKRFQVFISSTYEDLIPEREVVSLAILRSHNIPSGMELSSGANNSTLDVIYRWIDDSDIYILLLGGRYGSVDAAAELSYTELEYNYAKAHCKPVIALWFTDEYIDKKIQRGSISVKAAYERVHVEKFTMFRSRVTKDSFCIPIADLHELEAKVFAALDSVKMSYSAGGWIRTAAVLEQVLDQYARYANCCLDILTGNLVSQRAVDEMLRTLNGVIKSFVCPEVGWLDVMIPVSAAGCAGAHLLIPNAVSEGGWLRILFSSIRRTNTPTLIPIEINGVPWRGSGNAFVSCGMDYVSSFRGRYRGSYNLPPEIVERMEHQYAYWRQEHYFAALLAVAVLAPDEEPARPVGVLNLNFVAEDPIGVNDTLPPQRSLTILNVLEPALRALAKAIDTQLSRR